MEKPETRVERRTVIGAWEQYGLRGYPDSRSVNSTSSKLYGYSHLIELPLKFEFVSNNIGVDLH